MSRGTSDLPGKRSQRRGVRGWDSQPFRFTCGDETFVRHFAETSPERREATARTWAAQKGYALVGPA